MTDRPTLWKWEHWPDCGHQGCSDALRDTVTSQGMVPATRDDLLAALGLGRRVKKRWRCNEFAHEFPIDPSPYTKGPLGLCGLPSHEKFGCGWYYIIPVEADDE